MQTGIILSTAANAVLPLVLLILLGYVLRRTGYMPESFVKTGNKIMFQVLIPVMLFVNVYDLESIRSIDWSLVLYGCCMVLVLFGFGIVIALVSTKAASRRSVILQASFRGNMSVIGLPLAGALGTEAALGAASMLSAFTVAMFNALAVIAFTIFSDNHSDGMKRLKSTLRSIMKNPLILSICAGFVVLLLRSLQELLWGRVVFSVQRDIPFLYTALKNLKAVTTPFSLLILGGQFVFSAVSSYRKEIAVGSALRIVFAPLLGIGVAVLLGRFTGLKFGQDAYPALIALFGAPAAVSGPVMASQMGADAQLATQIVVWTSIGSIFTIFATACLLMSMGLLPV